MSDSNRVGLRYAKTSNRVIPITLSPNELKALRITGTPSLSAKFNSVETNEIRADRQRTDLILVGQEAGGSIGFEMSYNAFDDMIESALFSSWVNVPNKTGTSEITATGAGTVDLDDSSDIKVNHVVRVQGTTGADIGHGVYYVTANAANQLSLTPLNANTNAMSGSVTIGATSTLHVVGLRAAVAGDLDISVASGVLSVTAPAGFFTDAMGSGSDLVPGQFIKTFGFDDAQNNAFLRIISVTGTTITAIAPTGSATESTTGNGVVFFGSYVRNGAEAITSHQFAFERRFEDHSPVLREQFTGMAINTFTIDVQPQSIATGTIDLFGFEANLDTTVTNLWNTSPTDVEAPQFDVYNTSLDAGQIAIGGDLVSAGNINYVLQSQIELNNNLRRRPAVGVFGAASIGAGEFTCGGQFNTYFDDKTFLDLVRTNVATSYTLPLVGSSFNTVLFDMPRIKITEGEPPVPGKNQDVVLQARFEALRDPTLTYTLHAQKFDYAA